MVLSKSDYPERNIELIIEVPRNGNMTFTYIYTYKIDHYSHSVGLITKVVTHAL